MGNGERPRFDWVQFGILLLAVITHAVWNENRLARIEQLLVDSERERLQLELRVQKDEDKWEAYQRLCNQSHRTP